MKIALRDYQIEAVEAVFDYWNRAPSTSELPASPLVVMPTGSGKSPTIGETVRRLVQDMGCRVLVATHRSELIVQDVKAIRSVWVDAPIGIYSASLGRKEIGQITVAGVQSIAKQAKRLGHIDVMIVDEAHLIPATASENYGRLISSLRAVNPDMRLLGYTATPFRLGQGYLTQGDGAVFTAIAYEVGIRRLIEAGFLAPVVTQFVRAKIDTSKVHTVAGEFNLRELGEVSDTDEINDAVADDVADAMREGRTSAIVFAANLEHAARLRNTIQMRGVSCEVVKGDTAREAREAIYTRFKSRKLQCICSCEVLTTGFDAPVVDVVALVRATLSPALYIQMVGRGTRIADGKADCRLLDYGGNIDRHGPIDAVHVKPKKSGGDAPVKTCEACLAQCLAGCRECPHCGAAFPEPQPKKKLEEKASEKAALSFLAKQEPPRRDPVGRVEWHRHSKRDAPNAPPTLRLDYFSPAKGALSFDKRIASQWVCVEHEEGTGGHNMAKGWWKDQVPGCRFPTSVDDAIELLDMGYMPKVIALITVPSKNDPRYREVKKVLQERPREPGEDDGPLTPPPLEPLSSDVRNDSFIDDDLPF